MWVLLVLGRVFPAGIIGAPPCVVCQCGSVLQCFVGVQGGSFGCGYGVQLWGDWGGPPSSYPSSWLPRGRPSSRRPITSSSSSASPWAAAAACSSIRSRCASWSYSTSMVPWGVGGAGRSRDGIVDRAPAGSQVLRERGPKVHSVAGGRTCLRRRTSFLAWCPRNDDWMDVAAVFSCRCGGHALGPRGSGMGTDPPARAQESTSWAGPGNVAAKLVTKAAKKQREGSICCVGGQGGG